MESLRALFPGLSETHLAQALMLADGNAEAAAASLVDDDHVFSDLIPDTSVRPIQVSPLSSPQTDGSGAPGVENAPTTGTGTAQKSLEEQQMERAIAASLQSAPVPPAASTTTIDEDAALQDAIAKSLKRKSSVSEVDSCRDPTAQPAGLDNVGNTCYANAILQIFFNLPQFRSLILAYNTTNNSDFLENLQRNSANNDNNSNNKSTADGDFAMVDNNNAALATATALPSTSPTATCDSTMTVINDENIPPSLPRGVSLAMAPPPTSTTAITSSTSTNAAVSSLSLQQTNVIMGNLQELFARLSLSKHSVVNPHVLLESIIKVDSSNTKPVLEIGFQQDVSEFCQQLLSLAETGLKLNDRSGTSVVSSNTEGEIPDGEGVRELKSLFYGNRKVKISSWEEDGTHVEVINNEPFSSIILDIENVDNLYASLDKFTASGQIDGYLTPRGFRTIANSEMLFSSLPRTITFQLQRVKFNGTQGEKLNSFFQFSEIIYMDRYLETNIASTRELQKEAAVLSDRLETLRRKLQRFVQFTVTGGVKVRLDQVLEGTLRFTRGWPFSQSTEVDLTVPSPHPSDDATLTCVQQYLNRCYRDVCEQMVLLETEIAELQQQHDRLFQREDLRRHGYRLHSILVHQGTAGIGHYWSFVRLADDSWWRFNDKMVKPVDLETVMRESFGGDAVNSSAYCVLYEYIGDGSTTTSASATTTTATANNDDINNSNNNSNNNNNNNIINMNTTTGAGEGSASDVMASTSSTLVSGHGDGVDPNGMDTSSDAEPSAAMGRHQVALIEMARSLLPTSLVNKIEQENESLANANKTMRMDIVPYQDTAVSQPTAKEMSQWTEEQRAEEMHRRLLHEYEVLRYQLEKAHHMQNDLEESALLAASSLWVFSLLSGINEFGVKAIAFSDLYPRIYATEYTYITENRKQILSVELDKSGLSGPMYYAIDDKLKDRIQCARKMFPFLQKVVLHLAIAHSEASQSEWHRASQRLISALRLNRLIATQGCPALPEMQHMQKLVECVRALNQHAEALLSRGSSEKQGLAVGLDVFKLCCCIKNLEPGECNASSLATELITLWFEHAATYTDHPVLDSIASEIFALNYSEVANSFSGPMSRCSIPLDFTHDPIDAVIVRYRKSVMSRHS